MDRNFLKCFVREIGLAAVTASEAVAADPEFAGETVGGWIVIGIEYVNLSVVDRLSDCYGAFTFHHAIDG